MTFLGERMREYRRRRDITQKEMAQFLGVSQGQVSRYENCEDEPSYGRAKQIADMLGVTVGFLFGEEGAPETGSEKKKGIEPQKKRQQHENQFDINDIMPLSKPLPVYAWASCGHGTLVDETPIDYQTKPAKSKGEFWVIAKGNSMRPKIQDGYLLLVTKDISDLKNGSIVILIYDDEIFCKYYSKQGESYVFTGEDKSYPPIVVNPVDTNTQNFRIVGKVTALAISLE